MNWIQRITLAVSILAVLVTAGISIDTKKKIDRANSLIHETQRILCLRAEALKVQDEDCQAEFPELMPQIPGTYLGTIEVTVDHADFFVDVFHQDGDTVTKEYLYRIARQDGLNGYCEIQDERLYETHQLADLLGGRTAWGSCEQDLLRP